jgi:hypothetical protein
VWTTHFNDNQGVTKGAPLLQPALRVAPYLGPALKRPLLQSSNCLLRQQHPTLFFPCKLLPLCEGAQTPGYPCRPHHSTPRTVRSALSSYTAVASAPCNQRGPRSQPSAFFSKLPGELVCLTSTLLKHHKAPQTTFRRVPFVPSVGVAPWLSARLLDW